MTDNSSGSEGVPRMNNRRFRDKISKQWAIFCGDCSPARNYIASRNYNSCWAIIKFLDALFRGYGQAVFANNPISGILIFIGLTVANPVVSAAGLLTACVGLLVSIAIIPQPEEVIVNGLTVFNPLLVGLVTGSLLPTVYGIELEYWHFFFMVVTAIICVYVTTAIGNILNSISRYPMPYLTLPFNVVQQLLFLLLISLGPVKIEESKTSVEPQLLNYSVIHGTSQPAPLTPVSLVSLDRLVQTHTTEHFREWENLEPQKSFSKGALSSYQHALSDENYFENKNSTPISILHTEDGTQPSPKTNSSENEEDDLSNDKIRHIFRKKRSSQDEDQLESSRLSNNSRVDGEKPVELDWGGVFAGIVLSMSQAYAFNYAPTSLLIYLAVLIYSPITAAFGVVGATVGTVAGVYLTEPETYAAAGGVYDGTWGFNGVLCAMCLGGLFFVITWSSAAIAVISVLFSTVLQHVFLPSFSRADLLPLTLPFNLSAMLFLCVTSRSLVRPKAINFPEKQCREYKQFCCSRNSKDNSSCVDEMEKDSEVEKKLTHTDLV